MRLPFDSIEDQKTTPDVRDQARGLDRLLIHWDGGHAVVPLPACGSLTVGRSVECEVRIEHASVSRKHAILHLGRPVRVQDLGSSNGTRVAGKRLESGATASLSPGEVMEIGRAVLVLQSGPEAEGAAEAVNTVPPTSASPASVTSPVGATGATRADPPIPPGIVVADPAMERVYRMLELVAKGTISVLVLGETGAGKEIAAETIHRFSPRHGRPLLAVNCAALPETLLESELFGHERGAFTGAVTAKPGLLEAASGGTVFLDEVGEMPLATQAKLLRVVETRQLTRLGGLSPRLVDIRLISATNLDLEEHVRQGRFRQDLLFRLGGVRVVLPPLRERPLDIAPLARLFVQRASAELGKRTPGFSDDALGWLLRHPWPGNVRELRNVIDRAVLLCGERDIGQEHLQEPELSPASGYPASPTTGHPMSTRSPSLPGQSSAETAGLRSEVEVFERQRILEALERCGGNQTQAAKVLGISRRTLIDRLDAYDLPRPRKGRGAADA
ncbi:sigma 54-interacting transcriptional regulator [Chondromyces crocatus]|uniref:Fis family transcriptional regulator n=1 Tax=Chondromyces crocatus TaxID=52 RepID=A0A0K1ETT5_CHOCO|nr:sigma 54-interacting transcriptional regulator [Chondromyces crocatus]AKT44043.1 uncharacterized protein CMC5_082810 [Chondromyces crocatus]